MKEEHRWKILAALGLITLSLALYTVHFFIFHNSEHILIYLLGDIAFVPIEVLVVTLIIDQMLASRERQQRMEKLNMVIGIFFSRLGIPLLGTLSHADPGSGYLRSILGSGDSRLSADQVREIDAYLGNPASGIDGDKMSWEAMKDFLVSNEAFLMRIVENPMVFEHESFTDLIFAVNHLTEEIKARNNLSALPPSDIAHLTGDTKRVYARLVPEWMKYMEYLRTHYPYLHSLAMRTNPFDESADVVVRK